MTVVQVGLVDKTHKLDPKLLQATAASLGVQVTRDVAPYWDVQATVQVLSDPTHIPVGVWPVFLVAKLPPGEGGVHLDKKNQPYSLVIATPDKDDWTIDASHELVEMLVDPYGNRLQNSRAITISGNTVQDAPGEFNYLVEACDPCEGNQYAYSIQGIAVSDFITPHFYDAVATSGTCYSFGGNIQRPREILPDGYISFENTQSGDWQQILFLGPTPQLKDLGPIEGTSLRVEIDNRTWAAVREHRKGNEALSNWCKQHRSRAEAAAARRGKAFGF